jgi:hypothetical protein
MLCVTSFLEKHISDCSLVSIWKNMEDRDTKAVKEWEDAEGLAIVE